MVRLRALIVATTVAVVFVIGPASSAVRAGGGFTALEADATFGVDMTFDAAWSGSEPDVVELLLGFGGDDRLVIPVEMDDGQVSYQRDMTSDYVPPNTTIAYQWRAVTGAEVSLSAERTLVYDDDRPQFDWERDRVGSATVHWYGPNEAVAREFGDLAGDAADAAGDLLGRPLADPIDIFVYDAREDFLGAVGPAAREWVGAATYPDIRTVFMWLGAGSESYLRTTVAHEVTHVVFSDASGNPFHEPATWLNEGTATWAEVGNADTEEDLVRLEAGSADGLMAFEALTDQFPIDTRGASLAYAQGATMVALIIDEYGTDAMARIMDAYRDGATDDDAIEAGTDTPFATIREDYFAAFGVEEPAPIEPRPLAGSDVALPPQPDGGVVGPSTAPEPSPAGSSRDVAWWLIVGLVIVGVVFVAVVVWRGRRSVPPSGGSPS
jgi:hypothetical protein